MKKRIVFLCLLAFIFSSCRSLMTPVVTGQANLRDFKYVYVTPTAATVSSSGVSYVGYAGIYGNETRSVSPAEIISGYLMQRGYTIIPQVTPELKEQTLVVNYAEMGKDYCEFFNRSAVVMIQFVKASDYDVVGTSKAEGCGENDTDAIRNAISTALDAIFLQMR